MGYAAGQGLSAAQLGSSGPLPQGIIARGRRITNSSTTTTEIGVLRVDGIAVVASRLYAVLFSNLVPTSTVANDVVRPLLRSSTSGAATTSSTQLDFTQLPVANTSFPPAFPFIALYPSSSTATLSLLLSVSRQSGTGSASILAASTFPVDMLVVDLGNDPGDTGVII